MEIKPKYITFEQAKLLKEKGFNTTTSAFYFEEDKSFFKTIEVNTEKGIILAPEQWQVIEWLRVKHSIWIHVYYLTENKCWGWDCYKYEKENGLLNEPAISFKMNLQSPQEAYSAAFDYIFKNLI